MQRILASGVFSQHAKLNMAGFVLYLLGPFTVRCRMVELCPKPQQFISLPGKIWKDDSRYDSRYGS